MMKYEVVLANGDTIISREVDTVNETHIENEVYVMLDATGVMVFSAPVNSVVYMQQI